MSGYIGTQPVPQATQTRDSFTATSGQTSFATAGYTPQFLDVFLNGVHLQNGTDYTAANGSDVVLTAGAALGDVLEVVAYSTFDSANTYNRTEADAEFVNDPNGAITVSGSNLLVNTNVNNTSSAISTVATSGVINGVGVESTTTAVTGAVVFFNPNGQVGTISVSGSSTSYGTSSDYRLKTDAQPITGASARIQALNPVNFEWISDGTRVDGFLAHEAQDVVPESVTGTKDAMRDEEYEVTLAVLDDDGNVVTEAVMGTRSVPEYQGIDQSKLVPLLTAALQEALTKIDDMETRLTALEATP